MIPQQPRRGCQESPSLGVGAVGLFAEASPSSLEECTESKERNDLAFKVFIWSAGAGSWIPGAGAGFLCAVQYTARGMSVPHDGAQRKEPWS